MSIHTSLYIHIYLYIYKYKIIQVKTVYVFIVIVKYWENFEDESKLSKKEKVFKLS